MFHWPNLCPVLFADPFGLLVVMPRAAQPVTPLEADEARGDHYPDITSETKAIDFGKFKGMVVALDYGLPYPDMVRERRKYYSEHEQRLADAA